MAKYSCQICRSSFQFQQDLDKHIKYEHSGFNANLQSKTADRPSRYEGDKSQMSQVPRMSANDYTDGRIQERDEWEEIRTVEEPPDVYNRRPEYSQQDSRFTLDEDDEDSSSDSDNEEEESVEKQLDVLREECIPLREKLRGSKFKDLMNDLDEENRTDKIKASTKGLKTKSMKEENSVI